MRRKRNILIAFSSMIFLSVSKVSAQPSWVSGTPSVIATGPLSITLNYGINVPGTIYLVIYNNNNTENPSSATIRSRALFSLVGSNAGSRVIPVSKADAGKRLQVTLDVKEPDQLYTIYLVAADSRGRLQPLPVRLTARTLACPRADAGRDANTCGREYNLKASPGIGKGIWTKRSGPGSVTFRPDNRNPSARVAVSAYGIYVFQWTEVIGSCTISATVTIGFFDQIAANAGNGGDVCNLEFQLNAVPVFGSGTWTMLSGPGRSRFIPDPNQPDATAVVSIPGVYDFEWRETGNNCSSSDVIRVTFHPAPYVSAGDNINICQDGTAMLQALGEGTFSWSPATYLSDPSIANPIASPPATTTYSVILTDQWGCQNSSRVTVTVSPKPEADAGPDQLLELVFETRMEAAALRGNETGEWEIVLGSGTFSDKKDNNAYVKGLTLGDNIMVWNVSNSVCPPSSDTVLIRVREMLVPSLITPNLDGKNDFFIIKGIESLGTTSLNIFNRWGSVVYSSADYKNDWDGKDLNGTPLPEGTYFYVLNPENAQQVKGYVVIRR